MRSRSGIKRFDYWPQHLGKTDTKNDFVTCTASAQFEEASATTNDMLLFFHEKKTRCRIADMFANPKTIPDGKFPKRTMSVQRGKYCLWLRNTFRANDRQKPK